MYFESLDSFEFLGNSNTLHQLLENHMNPDFLSVIAVVNGAFAVHVVTQCERKSKNYSTNCTTVS